MLAQFVLLFKINRRQGIFHIDISQRYLSDRRKGNMGMRYYCNVIQYGQQRVTINIVP